MTYYDQENQFLRQRLQKEIPILTALIQNLYQELDRKFHLNGAKIPVTFGFETDSLGSYTRQSAHEKEHFHFSLLFVAYGLNYQKLGKQLMTEDEIAVMDGGKCILQLRGVRPFFSDKYDITKHPNYKYLSDYDKKNTFDMEKHLRRRPALVKPDEVFDYYEISESDLQEDTDHE